MEFRRVLVRSCELLVVLFGALVSQQRERRISHHGPVHRLPVRRVAQTCGELRILEYVNGCLAETGERFSFLQAKDLESPSDTYGIISTVGVKIHGANQPFYWGRRMRSEEHTSELQSLMRISYAVFCLKKQTHK